MIPLALLLACGPKIDPGPIPAQQQAAEITVLQQPASGPNLYLQAQIAAGAAYDPVGQEGLAALTAHALTDAGAGSRSADELRDLLYPTGTELEVVADKEWVSLRMTCHTDHQALCVEVFGDMLTAPRFDEAEVLRLRDQAIYAVGQGVLADEERLGEWVFDDLLYQAHPYGHPNAGRAGVLPLLDPTDLRRFYVAAYTRAATSVGIAGNYSADTLASLQQRLTALPSTPPMPLVLQQPLPLKGRQMLVVETGTPVTGFRFGHPLQLRRDDPDWPALTLAASALGEHRQSFGRLFQRLRGERGLNYGDYAYVTHFVQRGWDALPEFGVSRQQQMFYVWLRPSAAENGPFALKLALAEVEDLVRDGLSDAEVDDTRAYLLGHLPLTATNPGLRLAAALDAQASGQPNALTLLPKALPALSAADVNAAIARHIHPDDLTIVAVSGQAEELVGALLSDQPTPIIYHDLIPDESQAARDAEVAKTSVQLQPNDVHTVDAEGVFR